MTAYAGIGSRRTPDSMAPRIARIARQCREAGIILRSGAAPQADQMFEHYAEGLAEVYLPWPGFNGHAATTAALCRPSPLAFELASRVHPAWGRCSPAAKTLHARNAHQILGRDLDDPVAFVACWTPRGALIGGTATALRLAHQREIPIFNLATSSDDDWAIFWDAHRPGV